MAVQADHLSARQTRVQQGQGNCAGWLGSAIDLFLENGLLIRHTRNYGGNGYLFTQTTPEGNATNTNFKITNSTQPLAGASRAVIRTMDFLIA